MRRRLELVLGDLDAPQLHLTYQTVMALIRRRFRGFNLGVEAACAALAALRWP